MKTTKNLAEVIKRKLETDRDLAAAVDSERFNISLGYAICEARTRAGLTQKELADRVGMLQSAIARLENANYHGHSMKILQRIAESLGSRVEIRFIKRQARKSVIPIEDISIENPKRNADSNISRRGANRSGSLPKEKQAAQRKKKRNA